MVMLVPHSDPRADTVAVTTAADQLDDDPVAGAGGNVFPQFRRLAKRGYHGVDPVLPPGDKDRARAACLSRYGTGNTGFADEIEFFSLRGSQGIRPGSK